MVRYIWSIALELIVSGTGQTDSEDALPVARDAADGRVLSILEGADIGLQHVSLSQGLEHWLGYND